MKGVIKYTLVDECLLLSANLYERNKYTHAAKTKSKENFVYLKSLEFFYLK